MAAVRLVVDQPIGVAAGRAQAALLDPALYERLGRVSPIGHAEVLENVGDGASVTQRVRLRFTGTISPPASRFVDPDKISWVQETVTDLASRRTELRTVPDRYGRLLSMEGWYELREAGPAGTVQHLECQLRVNVPGLGRLAERGIARGMREHLAKEAEVIEAFCAP